jgi:hypothetical protein
MGFALTKWYIDLVTEEGVVAIAYWARVRYGPLSRAFAALLVGAPEAAIARKGDAGRRRAARPTSPPGWRFSARSVDPPEFRGDRLEWRAPGLGVAVRADRRLGAVSRRILSLRPGTLDWTCEAPAAAITLETPGAVLTGDGYAERLDMTIAPWDLPRGSMRWGRFVGGDAAVVWLDWSGAAGGGFVLHDGRFGPPPEVTEAGLKFGRRRLDLSSTRRLGGHTLGRLLGTLAPLRAIAGRIAGSTEVRWRSRGRLREPGAAPRDGWVVHERVIWR